MHRPTVEDYAKHGFLVESNKKLFDKYRSQLQAATSVKQLLGYLERRLLANPKKDKAVGIRNWDPIFDREAFTSTYNTETLPMNLNTRRKKIRN